MKSTILFSLDTPKYHLVELNQINHFSGLALDCYSKPVTGVNVYCDNQFIDSFSANLASEDIYKLVNHIPSAKKCRFGFDLYIDGSAHQYKLEIVDEYNSVVSSLCYDIKEVRDNKKWFDNMSAGLQSISPPPEYLVYLTQGIHDKSAYQNSIIPGIYNMKYYLSGAGVDVDGFNSILDMGCGTGRLLVGWYLDDENRRVSGCDINQSLIDWADKNLPEPIDFFKNDLLPPLPYEEGSFDFVYLVSVFTHLTLDTQKLWIKELERILAPEGVLLITLHGEIYLHLSHSQEIIDFKTKGYLETVSHQGEGANTFGTYHDMNFAEHLLDSFKLLGYYPRGNGALFSVAAFQDVYVFQKKSASTIAYISSFGTKNILSQRRKGNSIYLDQCMGRQDRCTRVPLHDKGVL
ncbi:MAG: class I SAM-dependent methyltransferase [Desulfobacterales bacterium]|nr:class I SAM-dependent methyltransferase [Desulfobacterales bacterium]